MLLTMEGKFVMGLLFLTDIIERAGIDPKRVKLIRHALSHKVFRACYNKGMVKEYTQHQKKDFSKGYDYWMVFISDGGSLARFEGFYRVKEELSDGKENMPLGYPNPDEFNGQASFFDIEKMSEFSDYENCLIIDWGKSARMWAQKGTTLKPIIAIQANQKKVFSGFEDMIVSYAELKEIVEDSITYESWHTALSSIYAVYLITDTCDGKQYVGSAYNKGGLLGRWKVYIETGHGNNKKMIELLEKYPDRYLHFEFSVLQILPKNLSDDGVVKVESLWKEKLHTREFGLNEN